MGVGQKPGGYNRKPVPGSLRRSSSWSSSSLSAQGQLLSVECPEVLVKFSWNRWCELGGEACLGVLHAGWGKGKGEGPNSVPFENKGDNGER